MNWGKVLAGVMAVESLVAAIGFWWAGDKQKAIYWLFACGINSTFAF